MFREVLKVRVDENHSKKITAIQPTILYLGLPKTVVESESDDAKKEFYRFLSWPPIRRVELAPGRTLTIDPYTPYSIVSRPSFYKIEGEGSNESVFFVSWSSL